MIRVVIVLRTLYVVILLGPAFLVGAFIAGLHHNWIVLALMVVGFVTYCLIAPPIARRIPREILKRQSEMSERLIGGAGKAMGGGWTPRSKRNNER